MKKALVFHTTHQTMLAEEVLSINGIFFDTVPIPKEIKTGCTIALSVPEEDITVILGLFKNENIVFEGLYSVDEEGWHREAVDDKKPDHIYMDYNSTTPVAHEVTSAMLPFFEGHYGNPSSIHSVGREARLAVDDAREAISSFLGADYDEIIFVGSGTEANNLAIKGTAYARSGTKGHIITSMVEHSSVLNSCRFLEGIGYEVTYLPVDEYGTVRVDELEGSITDETFLITIQWANNEVGTIQPVEEIGNIARARGIVFHSDAVQVVGRVPFSVEDFPVDMMTFSGHKFYGPKGIGGLYVRKNCELQPIIVGGRQERSLRAGTENVAGIAGMGAALMLAAETISDDLYKQNMMRDLLFRELSGSVSGVFLNGHPENRLPNTLGVSFEGINGESLAINLDLEGIMISTGAACASGSSGPSHVLKAMGVDQKLIKGSVRFSLGRATTEEDVMRTVKTVAEVVKRMRK